MQWTSIDRMYDNFRNGTFVLYRVCHMILKSICVRGTVEVFTILCHVTAALLPKR